MTAETHSAKQGSKSLDLRNLIETIPALVVCALPEFRERRAGRLNSSAAA
jgi:hypothetical protein